ncbi:MAG: DUF3016 domain-containing protein [Verrucomicrobia bacterium]|nr:DUF3016 domain-containing protein [Verrucomicrobiota bacterium]
MTYSLLSQSWPIRSLATRHYASMERQVFRAVRSGQHATELPGKQAKRKGTLGMWRQKSIPMKLTFLAICALAIIIGGFGCSTTSSEPVASTSAPSAPAIVTLDYVDPGRFTDFRINGRDFQHSSAIFTRDILVALRPVMARRFPGHTLGLRFTNIDLANRRTSGPQGLRVVPSSNLPSLVFAYTLQDPAGRTIASGSRGLVASNPASSVESRTNPVQIEADMMRRWLQTLRAPR